MSETVSFVDFCKRYALDAELDSVKQQYMDYSNNLDMFNDAVKEKKWGGARAGSGRKTKYESTKVMRVPEKYHEAVKALIKHLDDTGMIDFSWYGSTESKPVYLQQFPHQPITSILSASNS